MSFPNTPEVGWFIASIYLICGALRLARFNCLAAMPGSGGGKEFLGFPIPSAAGLVASVTLFLMWGEQDERNFATGLWRLILPGLMLFLSFMMVSEVKYPSFKTLDLRARRSFTKTVVTVLFIGWPDYLAETHFAFCSAGDFHRLPALRLCAPADFPQSAGGHRRGNRRRRGADAHPLTCCFDLPPSLVAALTGFLMRIPALIRPGGAGQSDHHERRGAARAGLGVVDRFWGGGDGGDLLRAGLHGICLPLHRRGDQARDGTGQLRLHALFGDSIPQVRTVAMPAGVEEQIKVKFNPQAAFAIGFVRVMANPGVFAFWIVLAVKFTFARMGAANLAGKAILRGGRGRRNLGLVQRA